MAKMRTLLKLTICMLRIVHHLNYINSLIARLNFTSEDLYTRLYSVKCLWQIFIQPVPCYINCVAYHRSIQFKYATFTMRMWCVSWLLINEMREHMQYMGSHTLRRDIRHVTWIQRKNCFKNSIKATFFFVSTVFSICFLIVSVWMPPCLRGHGVKIFTLSTN